MGTGLIAVVAAVVLAVVLGTVWRARNGQLRAPASTAAMPQAADSPGAAAPAAVFTTDDLGSPLGRRATLVQFSTAFCAPCRATRQILAEVAGTTDGVAYVDIDAESRLDLVRKLDVRRTPTVFVLDKAGHVARRASGQPRKADLVAALEAVSA